MMLCFSLLGRLFYMVIDSSFSSVTITIHLYFFTTSLISEMHQQRSTLLLWMFVTLVLLYNASLILGELPQFFRANSATYQKCKQTFQGPLKASYQGVYCSN